MTHQWSVDWPIDADTPPGTYVIEVSGRYVDKPGHVAGYAITSDPITVPPG